MFKVHLARNKFLNDKVQFFLVKSTDARAINGLKTYGQLAINESLTEELQLSLLKKEIYYIHERLAKNKAVSYKTQILLAQHKSFFVKMYLIANKSLCEKAYIILFSSNDPNIIHQLNKVFPNGFYKRS